jgi:hypothetical protein
VTFTYSGTSPTAQEIFDFATQFLIRQQQPSKNEMRCLYAGPHDTACAVGCFLPREVALEWDRSMAAEIDHVLRDANCNAPAWFYDHVQLLDALQVAHDKAIQSAFVSSFTENAAKVARKFKLEFSA